MKEEKIKIISKYPIKDILQNPAKYIDENDDELLLKFVNDTSNPVLLLLGYDDENDSYYFTLEDNNSSEDFYCKDGNLPKMFDEIIQGKDDYELWVNWFFNSGTDCIHGWHGSDCKAYVKQWLESISK